MVGAERRLAEAKLVGSGQDGPSLHSNRRDVTEW